MIETELLNHGYVIVLLGTLLEEDATLLAAAFLAQRGYLDFPWVLIVAGLSTLAANQVYFLIARRIGVHWLENIGTRGPRAESIVTWARRHGGLLVVASRFLIGFRTLIPIVVSSATGMTAARFLLWNAAGALLWTSIFGAAGYLGGHVFTLILDDIRRYDKSIAALLATGIAAFIFWKTRGRDLSQIWSLRKWVIGAFELDGGPEQ